jgi:hypothetical protein
MKAAGGVGQHGKYCGIVGDERVHECVGRDECCDEEEQAVLHVAGGKVTDSTAYFDFFTGVKKKKTSVFGVF